MMEPERYELRAREAAAFPINRRELLGLIIVVLAPAGDLKAQRGESGRMRGRENAPQQVNAWLQIGEDGMVTVFTGKVEVGQNARTSLTQGVADELSTPVSSVRLVMGDTQRTPFDMGTFGSLTTPTMFPQLRRAAAVARTQLIALAADKWGLPSADLRLLDGCVVSASGKSIRFGDLTRGAQLVHQIDSSTPLAPATEWRVAGSQLPKVDGREFVTGGHKYTSDMAPSGVLYGRVLRQPSIGAKLQSLDASAVPPETQARLVRVGDFAGVVASDTYAAARALAALKPQWSESSSQVNSANLYDHLKQSATAPQVIRAAGTIPAGLGDGMGVQQTYSVAYIAHAPLEPRAAVATWDGDALTVATGTQRPFGVQEELARAFDLDPAKVRVIVPDTGAAYGGKHTGECAIEAATLARGAKAPVKLVWTREEEFTWAYFRPAGVIEITGMSDTSGKLTAWRCTNYNSGPSGIETPYEVANQEIVFREADSPLRQGSYRALAATANAFARESAMDELAHALDMDPLAFRLANLKDERLRAVLQAAAQKFRWTKPPRGDGIGLACATVKGGYVATCVEIAVDKRQVTVQRAVTAFECGAIVNPDGLGNQVEGAIVMGLGGALFEGIRFDAGRVQNARFSEYRVPRLRDVPVFETVLLNRRDLKSSGAGECPIIALAPAVANAIHNATGLRLRSLPLVPNGLPA